MSNPNKAQELYYKQAVDFLDSYVETTKEFIQNPENAQTVKILEYCMEILKDNEYYFK